MKAIPPPISDPKILELLFKINFQGSFDLMVRCLDCKYRGPIKFWKPFIRKEKWSFGIECPRCQKPSNVSGMLNQALLGQMKERQ